MVIPIYYLHIQFAGFSGSYARQQEVMQRLQTECGNALPLFHAVPLENLTRQAIEDNRLLFILVLRSRETSDQLRRFVQANFSVVNDASYQYNNTWIVLFFNRFISNHGLIRMLNQSAGYAWCVQFQDLFEGI